jgi:hypothetical protein
MFVSNNPVRETSAVIHAAYLDIESVLLISAERIKIDRRCLVRHGSELRSADELAAAPHGDQFTDRVTVPGDGERLTVWMASRISLDLSRRSRWVISDWALIHQPSS